MSDERTDRLEQLLELLTEEIADRLRWEHADVERRLGAHREPSGGLSGVPAGGDEPAPARAARVDTASAEVRDEPPTPNPEAPDVDASRAATEAPVLSTTAEEGTSEPAPEPPSPPISHTARFLGRLALGLLALVVVINIPFNRHGTTLATAMPDRHALVIRDGLVVKEEEDPKIYVYQDGRFRWISSLKAFEMRGHTWRDVHVVEDGFLEPFEMGPPIHLIVKCQESPHIYRIEGEEKRWIVDIEAFEEARHVWEDVKFVSCSYLRDLPDGETIPPGHGPPPQP